MLKDIAILGWGSLLWEERQPFSCLHGEWQFSGPELKLEFSRVSKSTRHGALTLVIDPIAGQLCKVAYAISVRSSLADAIEDLRVREGTNIKGVGYVISDSLECWGRDTESTNSIAVWARNHNFQAAIWTDLGSNFKTEVGQEFSLSSALQYFLGLKAEGRECAELYIQNAPEFIKTPFREAVLSMRA